MLSESQTTHTVPADTLLPRAIRTLLLDDSTFDRARIRRISGATNLPIQLDEVGSIQEMEAAVRDEEYDLILIDYRLPIGDGMMALDHIHNTALNRNAGKIMITGNEALGTAVEAMRAGCHDFLCKDKIDIQTLRTAMLNALASAQHRALKPVGDEKDYRSLIRAGVLDALNDKEVRGGMVSLMRQTFPDHRHRLPSKKGVSKNDAFDTLIAGLSDTDDFIFH